MTQTQVAADRTVRGKEKLVPFTYPVPIFDRLVKVYAYDLVFRSGFEDHFNRVAIDRVQDELWSALGFDEVVGLARGYLSFPRHMVARDVPVLFPPDSLIVGLSAQAAVDEKLLGACRGLRELGYELAMEGFRAEDVHSPLLDCCDIVRIDSAQVPPQHQEQLCRELPKRGIRTVAMGIDTAQQFDQASERGFWYFQGEFFRRPVLQPGKEIPTGKLQHLRLLNEVNKPELAYDDLEALIKQDVAMTYRLLRFINSAWYGLKKTVQSIRHALVLLGPAQVRVWASMLVLKDMGEDKPTELFRRCLIRASMAESLAPAIGMEHRASELFLMGMFSLVDALTDIPIARVLKGLPLSEDIKMALLGGAGDFGLVYETVVTYETGRWEAFSRNAAALQLDESVMPSVFALARRWADAAIGALS